MTFKQLELEILDRAVSPLRQVDLPRPAGGWARAVRLAFGMTLSQLGQRVGVVAASIAELERNEVSRKIQLDSLERLAKGLGCELVYAIVPPRGKTFEDLVNDQAMLVARKRLTRVAHTMRLEAQDIDQESQLGQLKRTAQSLLSGSRRLLWR